jgi:hypothetical protein
MSVAVTKLRKATVSYFMSVCLSVRPSVRLTVRMEQFGFYWKEFYYI